MTGERAGGAANRDAAGHPYLRGTARPRVLAHRGFVPPAPSAARIGENSRAAIAAALALGAEYIESDCHLTSDGVVVLFHDADLVRTVGDPRPIAEVSHAELIELTAGTGGLISLQQALEEFPAARFNIDVKAPAAADGAGRIIAPHASRVLLTSFSDASRLRALRAVEAAGGMRPATSPGRVQLIRILLAATGSHRLFARACAGIDALQIPERRGAVPVLSSRLISAAHRQGVEVHVWTVNEPQRMRELVRLGVDGIITDRTDLALATLR